jgi:hypothetical protein
MNLPCFFRFLAGVLIGFPLFSRPAQAHSDDLAQPDVILQKAMASWKDYWDHTFSYRAKITINSSKLGKPAPGGEFVFSEKPDHKLLIRADSEGRPNERLELYAYNPDYAFSLVKRVPSAPWVVTSEIVFPVSGEIALAGALKSELNSKIQSALLTIGPSLITDLAIQPTFRVISARQVTIDGSELVQLDFTNTHTLEQSVPFEPIQSGTVTLDPNHSWCVRAYESKAQYSNSTAVYRSKRIVIKESDTRRFPLPVQIEKEGIHWETPASAETRNSIVAKYDIDDSHAPSNEEFMISKYGIREPSLPAKMSPFAKYGLILTAMIGLGFVCLRFFIYRYRKTK